MSMRLAGKLLFCCTLSWVANVDGAILHVPVTYPQISTAITAASNGDSIYVNSNSSFDPISVGKPLLIQSINGTNPLITATGSVPAVSITTSNVSIRGITIRGGSVWNAATVNNGLSGTTFEDCTFTTNGSTNFGIIGNENVTVRRCTFSNLLSPAIGPTYITPCSFRTGTLTVDTCVFDGCGMDFDCNASGTLTCSTVDGASSYAVYGLPSGSTVTQTIFSNCGTVFVAGCPSTFTNCLLYNYTSIGTGCSASGQLTDDPLYCNSRESLPEKYTLRIDSPAAKPNNAVQIGAKGAQCAWGTLARNTTVDSTATLIFGLEDVTVPTGQTLGIRRGVTFKWDDDDNSAGGEDTAKNELIVSGTLNVLGNSPKPVNFTSAKATPAEGDWAGIVVKPSARAKIDHGTICYAEDGVRAVYTADSTKVTNSSFSGNQLDDISAAGDNSHYVTISNNTVTVGGGIGISVSASEATVSGNTVTCNSSSVDGIELAAENNQVVSSNTSQSASMGSAIWIGSNANKTPTVQDNSFINSKFGIECVNSKANVGASSHVNTITGNTTGVLADGSNAKPKLRYNDISSNSTGVSAKSAADPDMGTNVDGGNNKFLSNSTYCINNRNTSGTLTAKGNWFGNPGGCPTPACFTGSVDVSGWLCTAPFTVEFPMEALPNGPSGFRVLGVRPNPTRSGANFQFSLNAGSTDIQVEVFDIAGRLVRRLDPLNAGMGTRELFWDGRDERGSLVQTGVYFFRASGHGIPTQSVKLLVVR